MNEFEKLFLLITELNMFTIIFVATAVRLSTFFRIVSLNEYMKNWLRNM